MPSAAARGRVPSGNAIPVTAATSTSRDGLARQAPAQLRARVRGRRQSQQEGAEPRAASMNQRSRRQSSTPEHTPYSWPMTAGCDEGCDKHCERQTRWPFKQINCRWCDSSCDGELPQHAHNTHMTHTHTHTHTCRCMHVLNHAPVGSNLQSHRVFKLECAREPFLLISPHAGAVAVWLKSRPRVLLNVGPTLGNNLAFQTLLKKRLTIPMLRNRGCVRREGVW